MPEALDTGVINTTCIVSITSEGGLSGHSHANMSTQNTAHR